MKRLIIYMLLIALAACVSSQLTPTEKAAKLLLEFSTMNDIQGALTGDPDSASVISAAIKIAPGLAWGKWGTGGGDSITTYGYAKLSQNSANGQERIITDTADREWIVSWVPDSVQAALGISDSLAAHLVLITNNGDSIITHRSAINGNTDSLVVHRSDINTLLDSIAVHRIDIDAGGGGGGTDNQNLTISSGSDSLLIESGAGLTLNQVNWLKRSTAAVLRPFRLGPGDPNSGADALLVLTDTVDNATSSAGSARGFQDASVVNKSGDIAYNSYDANGKIIGSNNYDHFSGFQTRFTHAGSGTVTNAYGFSANMVVSGGGAITSMYNFRSINPTVSSGSIGTLYGIYTPTLNAASTNYALYIDQSNTSRIGGTIQIGNLSYTPSASYTAVITDSVLVQTSPTFPSGRDANMLVLNRDNGAVGDLHNISFEVAGGEFAKIGAGVLGSGNSRMSFFTATSGAGTTVEAMRIGPEGEVSIGAGAATNADAKLEVTGGAFLLPRLTTTERNALTPTNGMLIYNTTTTQIEGYENGSWVDI